MWSCEKDVWITLWGFTHRKSPICRDCDETVSMACFLDGVEVDDFANDLLDLKAERQAIDEAERQTIDVDWKEQLYELYVCV